LALGLFLISRLQLYHQTKDDLELREIVDTQFVGCISPESAGGNRVDPRLMTLFSVFNCTFPSNETTQGIYNAILSKHVEEFHEDIKGSVAKITEASMGVYLQIKEKLPRTPVKFHYIFNLRDLSRVYEGLLNTTPDKFPEKANYIRLWRNECLRVFNDRLLNYEDQNLIGGDSGVINMQIKQHFKDCEEVALANPCTFGDFTMSNPTDEEAEDPRLYEDLN
jgi:dynein heavy chain